MEGSKWRSHWRQELDNKLRDTEEGKIEKCDVLTYQQNIITLESKESVSLLNFDVFLIPLCLCLSLCSLMPHCTLHSGPSLSWSCLKNP